jgi:hypothetical protein
MTDKNLSFLIALLATPVVAFVSPGTEPKIDGRKSITNDMTVKL